MNKSEIIKKYNVVKILTAKDLAILSKTYKDNLEEIIVQMIRKTKNPDRIDQLIKAFNDFKTEMKDFKTTITDRLDNIIKLNNLKE